jgi:flagellin-like hook-associated protein FlgL
MASNITLSAGVRQNLLSLQNTAQLMATTQNRLATGKKVNSALDNPSNFFTSASLQSRGNDLSALLDSMSNGIKTLEAADNGMTSITKTVESMQSTLRQARQDKSFQNASFSVALPASPVGTEKLSFSGGSVGTTAVDIALTTSEKSTAAAVSPILVADNGKQFTVSDGTTATADITLATGDDVDDIVGKINAATTLADNGIVASNDNGKIKLSSANNTAITVANGTTTGGATVLGFAAAETYVAKTADQIAAAISANAALTGKVTASSDNGSLRITNNSLGDLTVAGASSGSVTGSGSSTIGGNNTRKSLVKQFNELRDQLNKTADDAGYNGVNLLRKDKMKLTFNETGTSTMEIQVKDSSDQAMAIDADALDIATALDTEFGSDDGIDSKLDTLGQALGTLRSQASSLGSKLSIVQNRQDFTKSMINTLQTGADKLVLADTNEEAANLLALQTRQQLSSTALSMASQADQAVLRLF